MLTSPCMFHIGCCGMFFTVFIPVGSVWVRVGAVTSLGYLCGSIEDVGLVTDSPHTGSLLSTSSTTLPSTAPGTASSTSAHAAITSRDQQGQVRADWDATASALVHFIGFWGQCVAFSPTGTAEETLMSSQYILYVLEAPLIWGLTKHWVTPSAWCWITGNSAHATGK